MVAVSMAWLNPGKICVLVFGLGPKAKPCNYKQLLDASMCFGGMVKTHEVVIVKVHSG